jgi:WhiB family redox-sensing transcriptional regulator
VLVSAQRIEDVWWFRAACRGPRNTIFYPPPRAERRPDKRRREQQAKEICDTCPVRQECLAYAVEVREQHGIWGGLTEKERRALIV